MCDDEFSNADSGAALTYPAQCSSLRKGGHAMLKGYPCKIVEMTSSKTGKHGHAKVNLTGLDIFTNKKYEDMSPSTHNMEVPNVARNEYTVIDMDDEYYVSLMDDMGETRQDLQVEDEDLRKKFKEALDQNENPLATVLKAIGKEKIMSMKPQSDKP